MSVIVTIIWLQEKLLMNSLWVLNKKKEPMTNLKWILVTGHSTILKVFTMNTLGINTYYFANSWDLLRSLYEFFKNYLCCLGMWYCEIQYFLNQLWRGARLTAVPSSPRIPRCSRRPEARVRTNNCAYTYTGFLMFEDSWQQRGAKTDTHIQRHTHQKGTGVGRATGRSAAGQRRQRSRESADN